MQLLSLNVGASDEFRTRVTQMENRRHPFHLLLVFPHLSSHRISHLLSSHRVALRSHTHTHSHTVSPLSLSSSLTSYLASYLDSLISYPSISIYRRLLISLKKNLNMNPSQLFFFLLQVWDSYFYLSVIFINQPCLQLESFSPSKRKKILEK